MLQKMKAEQANGGERLPKNTDAMYDIRQSMYSVQFSALSKTGDLI
jgi:hypothetical protein